MGAEVQGRGMPRGRGISVGLTIEKIVDAAKAIDPGDLTVTSVAEALGVDRKAVSHHIPGRAELLSKVADSTYLDVWEAPAYSSDWRDMCHQWVRSVAAAGVALGPLLVNLQLDFGVDASEYMECAEALMAALSAAGLDDFEVARICTLITSLAFSHAYDRQHLIMRNGVRVRSARLRGDLERTKHFDNFPTLERIVASDVDTYSPDQLTFAVDLILDSVEARLAQR